jgi:cell division protein FtsB
MSKHQVLEEFKTSKKRNFYLFLKAFFLVLVVIGLGIYVGNLLYGKNSLEVLLNLQEKKEMFKNEIEKYKQENAKLQKEYFELLQLEPGEDN